MRTFATSWREQGPSLTREATMANWADYSDEDAEEVDLGARRYDLRLEMCGDHEPSDLLSLAIYEAVAANAWATSDDVLELYLQLAADEEPKEAEVVADEHHHAA